MHTGTATTTIDALMDELRAADAALVRRGAPDPNGRIEGEARLPRELILRLVCRRTRWDANDLSSVAELTTTMPRTLRADEMSGCEPEQIVAEVEDLVASIDPRRAARQEQRDAEAEFLLLQPFLEGGGSLYGGGRAHVLRHHRPRPWTMRPSSPGRTSTARAATQNWCRS